MKKIYKNIEIVFYYTNLDVLMSSALDSKENFGSVNDFLAD